MTVAVPRMKGQPDAFRSRSRSDPHRRTGPAALRDMSAALLAGVVLGLAIGLGAAAVLLGLRARATAAAAQIAAACAADQRRNLLQAVHEGLWIVDPALRTTHANPEAARLLHTSPDALAGVRLEEIEDPLAAALLPDVRAASRSGIPLERVHAFPDRRTWIEVRIVPAAGETVISLRDVSAQTIAESQLHENAHSLQLVTNNVDAVLWTAGRDGRFNAVSGGALEDLGLSAADLLHQPCEVLVAEQVIEEVFAGRATRVESPHGERWLRHHVEPLNDREHNVIGAVGVSIDITELKRTQRQLFDAAHRDRLTGLPNRFSLEQRLQAAIGEAAREKSRFALVFLDLDRFKWINDTLGHGAGDEVLREVALRLQGAVRSGDFIARPGGDEFVVVLPRINGAAEIEAAARRLIRALGPPIRVRERDVHVGASAGAAVFPDHGRDAESLTAHADAAMYRAKATASSFVLFEESIEAEAVRRFSVDSDLRSALERGELMLKYQPLVDLTTRRVVGCEALVRWNHPLHGTIAPAGFVSIAEESGTIVEIDRWVLREACAAAARLRAGLPDFHVAVNLSARGLRDAGDITAFIAALLAEHGLPASALVIEIAESAALRKSALPRLQQLRELGVRIAIDDFAASYSALAHLGQMPVHVLKIDRSFVAEVAENRSGQAIVASIVAMAKSFGLSVVAEGVESDGQAQAVASLGCHGGQGSWYGEPQDLAALEALLARRRLRPA